MRGNIYYILKQLGFKGLVLVACLLVGLILILIVPTFPMKLLGIGVVILSILGLVISFYQRGYVSGKEFIVEERKPSTPLPKNIKIDEIETDKGKIKTFENVETEVTVDISEIKVKKSPKKKSGFVQGFINFVAKSEEKSYFPSEKKLKEKKDTVKNDVAFVPELSISDEFEGSFKILRKSKSKQAENVVIEGYETESKSPESETQQPEVQVEVVEMKVQTEATPVEDFAETKLNSKEALPEVRQEDAKFKESLEKQQEKEVPSYQNRKVEVEFPEEFSEENLIKGEPIKEMKLLFERLLNVIGTVTKAVTSSFFLVNKLKNELVLQAIVSHNPDALKKVRKIPLGGDLVSQIVQRGKPEIIDFNTSTVELDLLPYYEKPVGARTFIGVPLTLRGSIIGVLCADSVSPEAFDHYTMNFFLHYAKIFSFFLESYTEKYELLVESQILGFVDELRKGYFGGGAKSVESIKSVINSILNLFDFVTFGICLYDFDAKFYRIYYIRSKKNIDLELKNKKVDLKRSLLGKALTERRVLNVEFDEHKQRVHYSETKYKKGNFIAIPIKTQTGVYGALFGWTDEVNPILVSTIRVLEDLAFALGLFYENDYLNFITRTHTKSDKVVEKDNFVRKVEEEWMRAVEFGIPFSVCKIAIDNYIIDNNLFQEFDSMSRKVVSENLKKILKEYDYICQLEDKTIGVVLIGKSGKDAKLLFEMLRKNIAQTMLKINNENIFFTISVGIAQFSQDINVSKLIENVDKALEIACIRKNTVTLY